MLNLKNNMRRSSFTVLIMIFVLLTPWSKAFVFFQGFLFLGFNYLVWALVSYIIAGVLDELYEKGYEPHKRVKR